MCGIIGYLTLDNQRPIDGNLFVEMNDAMQHRGPDGDGFYFSGSIYRDFIAHLKKERPDSLISHQENSRIGALGHRRLSIIDLNVAAGQPMCDDSGQIWLVFNGEIYNHREIRQKLLDKGHTFKTDHSDTETIIYAYKEWGKDFIHQLRGMFAIVLWDHSQDTILLYRDRTGVKPLYYTVSKGRFYFASEIKALLKDKTIERNLNEEGMYHYMSFLTVPAPDTLFKNVHKLAAGCFLEIKHGKVSQQKAYWDVFDNVSVLNDHAEEEIQHTLLSELKNSINCHLESDVPVGVFLSGGVDSSVNAALFSEVSKEKVKAFSIGYANDHQLSTYTNEFKYSRAIAKKFDLDYYELELTQDDLINSLTKLMYHQDEPIADPVCVPVYYVSKLARENGIKVAQVGEGSDELFWGYKSWKTFLQLQNLGDLPTPNILKRAGLSASKHIWGKFSQQYEMLRRNTANQKVFWGGAQSFYETPKTELLSGRLKHQFQNYSSWEALKPLYQKFLATAPEPSNLNWMSYLDLKLRLPELLLMRVDKMAMAVSLEGRVPFLDYKFVEYAMSIPSKLKTKNNESKYILKKAVESVLPHEIIYREKQGFGAPVYDWFFSELGDLAKEKITAFNKDTEVFDKQFLKKRYIDANSSKVQTDELWNLLNLAVWWEIYIK